MYKIEEIDDGKFKLFQKFWFFWVSLMQDGGYAGDIYMVYNSLEEAQAALSKYVSDKLEAKKKQEQFKKRAKVYLYNGDQGVIRNLQKPSTE
jgi:hypothetical protein